jgi:glycosyltransferase involved in cell wall biosynthesis
MATLLPISAIVATRHRPHALARTLSSLALQSAQPAEVIVVDASEDDRTARVCAAPPTGLASELRYIRACCPGAAAQRNEGVDLARYDAILFHDDDIEFRPNCVARLWAALESDPGLGGVNAMIENQRYHPPGRASRYLFCLLNGKSEESYAGRIIGPAFNLLPEDRPDLPEVQPMEWLNTTCTLYRREALPTPVFPPIFIGASTLEDAALSLIVRQRWRLANARTARIFHEHLGGDHKRDPAILAEMELVNREYLMAELLGRRRPVDYAKLALLQVFQIVTGLRSALAWRQLPAVLRGKLRGVLVIWNQRRRKRSRAVLVEGPA